MKYNPTKDNGIFEYGDYQTPEDFVVKICNYIKYTLDLEPTIIIEPTFGLGNFIFNSINIFKKTQKVYGIEINKQYYSFAVDKISKVETTANIDLYNDNIFTFDFSTITNKINMEDNVLIIGNPPWVTNSDLTTINSSNLPIKTNFKDLKGLDAITGKSNFDIAEYIILSLLNTFKNFNCVVAMLCKATVAKNIIRDLKKYDFELSDIRMLNFSALEVFNVNCEACLLIMKIGSGKKLVCDVYDLANPDYKISSFGWVNNAFVSNIDSYCNLIDGKCQMEWRQGIKHDCSKVMELTKENGIFVNGYKEPLNIEDTYIYPVLKSSDIKKHVITEKNIRKSVIVTQKKVGDETGIIREKSPMLWRYLQLHSMKLDNRKSSIYKRAPQFAIFGIGDYSFKPYKVAISGFYKNPIFALTYNANDKNKPIMLDDTCYFLGFDNFNTALITTILLNSNLVQSFLTSIAFLNSKRPYTKEVLMRIDLLKVANMISFDKLLETADRLGIEHNLEYADYQMYVEQIASE